MDDRDGLHYRGPSLKSRFKRPAIAFQLLRTALVQPPVGCSRPLVLQTPCMRVFPPPGCRGNLARTLVVVLTGGTPYPACRAYLPRTDVGTEEYRTPVKLNVRRWRAQEEKVACTTVAAVLIPAAAAPPVHGATTLGSFPAHRHSSTRGRDGS